MRPDDLLLLCLANQPATLPHDVWTSWGLAPEVVLPLLLAAGLYVLGLSALRRRSGVEAVRPWQIACFAAGWLALVVAVVSPLCRMAATLASAHMVQHVILVAVAPPLLVLGTAGPILGGVPRWCGWLATPMVASLLYGAAVWFWHAPLPYQAALLTESLHLLMYATLIGAALLFWRSLIAATWLEPDRYGGAVVSALVTTIHTGLLGALLTFAPAPWYPLLGPRAASWGLSALEDQQLAGLIMWVPMGSIYLVGSVALMAAWIGALERRRPQPGSF
jgi:cytochrome c oxidase assembly factor CtaG